MAVDIIQWFDWEQGYGEIDIGSKTYRYVPAPAGDLGPDEWSRVTIRQVAQAGEPMEGTEYVCRSDRDGNLSCSCPDWQRRKGPLGQKCKHLDAMTEYGIIREPQSEPAGMETPW
jgi:hypothetical protein